MENPHGACRRYQTSTLDVKSAERRNKKHMAKNQHVVPRSGNWAVRGEGNQRDTIVRPTQAEAIAVAREISRNQGSELFVHGRNGQIRERDSHGKDPNPPPG